MYERNGAKKAKPHSNPSSRVEMVIAIYDAAINSMRDVLKAIEAKRPHESTIARSNAIALVGLIENGLDLTQGEIPNRIKELCGFIEQAILTGDADELRVANEVLENLRDGFIGIKEEATELENAGKIPQLSVASAINTVI